MAGVAIVTGGGRGIGAAIVREAVRLGYKVCANYSRSAAAAEALVEDIRAGGGEAMAYGADVSKESEVVAMFEAVDRTFGTVRAMINNAAIDHEKAIADMDPADLSRLLEVNVIGPFLCARESIRRMATSRGGSGGTIVNISSVSARTGGLPRDVMYTASKGAVDAFTTGLAKEVAQEAIRVCAVRPGITETEIFDSNLGLDSVKAMARDTVPLGRIGQPEETAALVMWLCSPAASYITGVHYDVSGGR